MPRPTRRHYSEAFRAGALACLDANGGNVKRTARELGVPEKTLAGWAAGRNPVGAELRAQKRTELVESTERLAEALAGGITAKVRDGRASVEEMCIAFGIAVDKLLLLQNRANSRAESTSATVNVSNPGPGWDWARLTSEQIRELAKLRAIGTGQIPATYPVVVVDHDDTDEVPAEGAERAVPIAGADDGSQTG